MWLIRSLALLIVHLAGILIFCKGFFPSKVVLEGYGQFADGGFDPQFNKTVIMVVDALRSDFVFSDKSSMNFVQSLLRDGAALGYTAFSNPPTVTLPRLKGITTGSTPNFLDAVLNVVEEDTSSTLANQDSWLKQLKITGKRIHMFGDDTWIKLFPGVFDIDEGTNSFFVSDFTEVDNNVTRHLDVELSEQNWDCLILHYLGLDHIGHKGGPHSSFMPGKQKEMDNIVERIYSSLDDETLLILLGDHGMNEIGNHGGSSAGETSASLVFASKKLQSLNNKSKSPLPYTDDYSYYKKIQQIDLVPTLCSLLHIPTPKNSLGVMIRDFLPLWPQEQRRAVINENLLHYQNFRSLHITSESDEDLIYEVLLEAQSDLTRSATNYDLDSIHIALAVISVVCLSNLIISKFEFGLHSYALLGLTLMYGLSVFGSSLIEEEHQIWWWICTMIAVVLSYKRPWNLGMILILLRFVRGWNNSGQKFVGDTMVGHLEGAIIFKWGLIFVTMSTYTFGISNGGLSKIHSMLSFVLTFTLSLAMSTYKMLFAIANGEPIPNQLIPLVAYTMSLLDKDKAQDCLVDISRMIFINIGTLLVLRIGQRAIQRESFWFTTDIHNIITMLLIMQTSNNNIGIFLVLLGLRMQLGNLFESLSVENRSVKVGYLTFALIALQNLTFFSFGQTNSLNTVDLSNAYNGVTSYNIFAVGILTFLSNFAGPIFWIFAWLPIIFEGRVKYPKWEALKARWITNLMFYSVTTLLILGSCYAQRYHLFIWTVFSPKVLYTLVWNFWVNALLEFMLFGVVALL